MLGEKNQSDRTKNVSKRISYTWVQPKVEALNFKIANYEKLSVIF